MWLEGLRISVSKTHKLCLLLSFDNTFCVAYEKKIYHPKTIALSWWYSKQHSVSIELPMAHEVLHGYRKWGSGRLIWYISENCCKELAIYIAATSGWDGHFSIPQKSSRQDSLCNGILTYYILNLFLTFLNESRIPNVLIQLWKGKYPSRACIVFKVFGIKKS